VHSEIPRADHEIAPDARDQIPMADDLSWPFDQRNQNIERAISQRERNPVALDLAPLCR
jgi:hypothetical protein